MKLTLNDLRNVSLGAAAVSQQNGKIRFHRFTETEELVYKRRDEALGVNLSERGSAPAGIKLRFNTNSKTIKIIAEVESATSRSYFSFDVFENGRLVGYLDNFTEQSLQENYTRQAFSLGRHEKTFALSCEKSEITVYFPWSVFIDDIEIELDDGAFVEPVKPQKKLLAYGDSITQGYDALRPSNRYASKLAEYLGAEEINKAIGGEVFVPELAKEKLDFTPDYITVAYGTNDWCTTDGREFYQNVKSFFGLLSEHYPSAKIFAISPIWRAGCNEYKPFGDFSSVERVIRETTASLKNVTVISGFDLVGHNTKLFADLCLHPRDEGFNEYFKNLSRKIEALL